MTEMGSALAAWDERKANPPEQIDNASLVAGSDMYYYCKSCGHLACVLPETWITGHKKYCDACQEMIDKGWLTP